MEIKTQTQKKFWFTVLFVSIVAVWILVSAPLEVYFGINMPFVNINHEQFNLFGYEVPKGEQWGIMLLSGLLLMLPARTVHLALIKLEELKKSGRPRISVEFQKFKKPDKECGQGGKS